MGSSKMRSRTKWPFSVTNGKSPPIGPALPEVGRRHTWRDSGGGGWEAGEGRGGEGAEGWQGKARQGDGMGLYVTMQQKRMYG